MHLGNVKRILEKRVKHSATPRVLHRIFQNTLITMQYLRNRKRVACVYSVIMHAENVRRIREKRVKHSATPRVLHASFVFS